MKNSLKIFSVATLFFIALILGGFTFFNHSVEAESNEVTIYFFYGDGCPHCADEEVFLADLENRYDNLKIDRYEVWYDTDNAALMREVADKLGKTVNGVPLTVIGSEGIVGYLSDKVTGVQIENAFQYCTENECTDVLADSEAKSTATLSNTEEIKKSDESAIPESIKIPVFGEINTSSLSLPVFTIVIGLIDGFNPCAMWVLLFLISLLLGMKNRTRMWILGITFIVASGTVYFIFMAAWLNVLILLGFVFWVRFVIGLVSLGGGIFNLREYRKNKDGTCKVTASDKRQKTFARLKEATQEKKFWLAIGGIIVLAAAVNMVELVCSAGLPVVFTGVLALSNLSTFQYYLYLLGYIFFFMLDDIIVFGIAMTSLKSVTMNTKYARFSNLIGGIIMLIVGLLLIFRPEMLMFG
ncbi:MAG: hypothetical protein ABIE68_04700 [bacterium]